MPDTHTDTVPAGAGPDLDYDVVIVGAGLAGLYTLHRLRGLGLTAKAFEAGRGGGGTWVWNKYPGAPCVVERTAYSYAVSAELQQVLYF